MDSENNLLNIAEDQSYIEDLVDTFYWYQKAAEQGHVGSQNYLGYLHEEGVGTEKNLEKAFYWYQKAAENEYGFAQNNLGCLYEKGEGTKKNLEKAFYWYNRAAENGC